MNKKICKVDVSSGKLTKMASEVFNKLNAFRVLLLPEFQMPINTCRYNKIGPEIRENTIFKHLYELP